MLDLRIAGRQLLLPASTTASIEHINPLFADGLQDSHSVPIEVPADGNEATLQHVQEIALAERTLSFPQAQLGHQGMPLHAGLFQVLSSTPRTIRGVFSVEAFVSRIRGRKLPELLMGHRIDASDDGILAYAANNAPYTFADGVPCQFPMFFNKDLYGNNNPDWYPNASNWSSTSSYTVNDLVVFNELTPCFRQDIWQCTANASPGQSPATHPAKWRRTAFGIVNAWDAQVGEHYRNTTANFYALCPWFYLKWVLQKALNAVGYRPVGDFWENPDTDELVLPNLTLLDAEKRLFYFRAEQTAVVNYTPPTPWNLFRIPADDDSIPPNTDPNDVWDAATNTFTPNMAGTWRFRIRVNVTLSVPARLQLYIRRANGSNHPSNWPFPVFITPDQVTVFQNTVTFSAIFSANDVGNSFHFVCYAGANFTPVWPVTTDDAYDRSMVSGWLTSGSPVNNYRDMIDPSDHVPDVQFESWLVAIAEALNLELTPDEASRTLRLDHRENLLLRRELNRTEQSHRCIEHLRTELDHARRVQGIRLQWDMPRQDLPDLRYYYLNEPVHREEDLPPPDGPEQCAYVRNTRMIYLSELQGTNTWYWRPAGYNVPTVQVGSTTDAREVIPECTPLHMREVFLDGKRFLMPVMEGAGTSTYFNSTGDRSAILLCEYKRHSSSDGQVYKVPSARSWASGWADGDHSRINLLWTDDHPDTPGLYERFWANWAAMLTSAEPVTMDLLVDAPFLSGRDWRRILHIHGQDYLIEKMPVEYGANNGPLLARGTHLLRMRSNVVSIKDRIKTGLRCTAPGTMGMSINSDGVDGYEIGTDTGFASFRLPDGTVTTMEKSTGELPRDTSLCLFASNAFGEPMGAITHLAFTSGVTSLDLARLPQLKALAATRGGLTDITLPQVMLLEQLDLSGNALSRTAIDRILRSLDPSIAGGYVDLSGGTNATPSPDGIAAITDLQRNGWTVAYNK